MRIKHVYPSLIIKNVKYFAYLFQYSNLINAIDIKAELKILSENMFYIHAFSKISQICDLTLNVYFLQSICMVYTYNRIIVINILAIRMNVKLWVVYQLIVDCRNKWDTQDTLIGKVLRMNQKAADCFSNGIHSSWEVIKQFVDPGYIIV